LAVLPQRHWTKAVRQTPSQPDESAQFIQGGAAGAHVAFQAPSPTQHAPIPAAAAVDQQPLVTPAEHMPAEIAPRDSTRGLRGMGTALGYPRKKGRDYGLTPTSVLRGGEVLVSVVGTIGRSAIAPLDLAGANIARAVAKVPVRDFEAQFVPLWLSTSRAQNWMVGDAREVARKTLNLQQLRTLPIPLPPLAEQKEIVRRVEALFALAYQIETRYAKAQAHCGKLTQAILAKAFRGELVPQDPNDEPASVLLERIRAERLGKMPAQGRATRRKIKP
jgi:hypothetical protein